MGPEIYGSVGGAAGIIAVLFTAYKIAVKQMRDDRKFMENRLTTLIADYNGVCSKHTDSLVENTKVLSELITYLKLKNGSR